MEQIYALGISCIEFVQYWFENWGSFFEIVNNISNPHHVFEILFPIVSIIDSVFAAQLLLCLGFGGWLNAVMKWWILEDRPYWWVQETTFYSNSERPHLNQTAQSCETGPGSPSGHTATAASVLVLLIMWLSHVFNDRKWSPQWWKCLMFPMFASTLTSVMLARLYVATHFPHQCLIGGLIGSFLAPALCIYVSDPFIWQYGPHNSMSVGRAVWWHVFSAAMTILISGLTYLSLILAGLEPHYTVKLAFRWCKQPTSIHVSSTPMFALVQCTACLMSWALCVTPAVAKYRHYTKNRSILISIFATTVSLFVLKKMEENIPTERAWKFYLLHYILNVVKPGILLRVIPYISMWPFESRTKIKTS